MPPIPARPEPTLWDQRFEELLEFYVRFGSTDVPQRWAENPSLGEWVSRQRKDYKAGILSEEHEERLRDFGFVWEKRAEWRDMFCELGEYRRRFGDCNVPARWVPNPTLGHWVARQRRLRRQGALPPDKVRLLDSLGFEWQVRRGPGRWEAMLARLAAFHAKHGHCEVAAEGPPPGDDDLAQWVAMQRYYYHHKHRHVMGPKRVARLEELGFEWGPPPPGFPAPQTPPPQPHGAEGAGRGAPDRG